MVPPRIRAWTAIAGRITGSLAVWAGVLLLLGWGVFGVGLPALVLAVTLATPASQRSPEYEGTFEMGAFLLGFTMSVTVLPLALVLLAVGGLIGRLIPAPLYLGPLRRIGRAARLLWWRIGRRLPG